MPNSTINATVNGLNSTAGNVATLDLQVAGSTVASVGSTGISVTGTVSATGVSSFPAGSNTAPSITFTGDTNTGIYSPAADTIAFTEGGTEVMRINSSGNVGIGTTSPTQNLSVNGYISTNSNNISADNSLGFRNRIINGDMRIDQRNAGASVTQTTSTAYVVDRWNINGSVTSKFTAQRSTTAPTGFTNSLLITSSAATTVNAGDYYYLMQGIEGFNVADLAWGTANAKTVTLSFWVRSSLTGTFGGTLRNLISGATRSYPFTYTISAANTFEYKTITVTGDTSGTWATDNSNSLTVCFSFGSGSTFSGTAGSWAGSNLVSATGATSVVGTNGATFYITGVQLEVGSVATPFERRPFGTELFLCYRYYQKSFAYGTAVGDGKSEYGNAANTTNYATAIPYIYAKYPVQFRDLPSTVTLYNPRAGGTAGQVTNSSSDATGSAVVNSGEKGFMVQTDSQAANNWYVHWGATAEL